VSRVEEQVMRLMKFAVSASLVVASVSAAPSAWAYDPSINGTYAATTVGDYSRTNTVYRNEPVTHSIWKISTSCSTAQDCSGQVVNDQGWTAPINMHDGMVWFVKRDIPNWETCPDGTAWVGHDVVFLYPANPETGENTLGSPLLVGREKTTGVSGACGANAPLYVEQPIRLDPVR
jgi:hypothetical protein